MTTSTASAASLPVERPRMSGGRFALLAVVWCAWVAATRPLAHAIVVLVGLDPSSRFGAALEFFLFDAPWILLLMTASSFLMQIANSYFSAERVRQLLAGRREYVGNVMAALLGVVTPFCSCSAVPLFISFVEAGVPLGVTFSFLVSAPMVNEIALVMLLGLFGWKIALYYLVAGLVIAIISGYLVGRLHLEAYVENWVRERLSTPKPRTVTVLTLGERAAAAAAGTAMVTKKVAPYVLVGIAIAAVINGYTPDGVLEHIAGRSAWWAVPIAVAIGVPLYASALAVVLMIQPLLAKGAALGTMLAFTMAAVGLSLPELIILRKVLKPRLIGTFVGVVSVGILLTGWLFNAIL